MTILAAVYRGASRAWMSGISCLSRFTQCFTLLYTVMKKNRHTSFGNTYFIPNIPRQGHLIICQLSAHALHSSTLISRKKRCQERPVNSKVLQEREGLAVSLRLTKGPIAIGEVAKCVLSAAKGEAQKTCEIDQLCGGLQAGIEGDVHDMHSIWETHKMEWGFLPIGACNAFNEINRSAML